MLLDFTFQIWKKKSSQSGKRQENTYNILVSLCFDQEIMFCFLQGMQTIFESNYKVRVPLVWGALLKRV